MTIRYVLVANLEGKLHLEAFFCTDLQAMAEQISVWVVMRWSLEVTFEEARAHLGLETQRQWSALAIARITPVLLGLFSLVTVLALQLSGDGQILVPVTGLVPQGGADVLGLSSFGPPASLARAVFGELYSLVQLGASSVLV